MKTYVKAMIGIGLIAYVATTSGMLWRSSEKISQLERRIARIEKDPAIAVVLPEPPPIREIRDLPTLPQPVR